MFNMGFFEMILLGVIALIFIGPQQLPQVARTIAKLINELKRATGDLGSSFNDFKANAHQLLDDTEKDLQKSLDEVQVKKEPKEVRFPIEDHQLALFSEDKDKSTEEP